MVLNSLDSASRCRWTLTQNILRKQPHFFFFLRQCKMNINMRLSYWSLFSNSSMSQRVSFLLHHSDSPKINMKKYMNEQRIVMFNCLSLYIMLWNISGVFFFAEITCVITVFLYQTFFFSPSLSMFRQKKCSLSCFWETPEVLRWRLSRGRKFTVTNWHWRFLP